MEQNFDYKTVPFDYLHCQNAKCPHTADCLHYQVALHISKDTRFYPLINPAYVAGKEKKCPYFQKDELTHFAKGIKKLYDNVPHAKAMEIRRILYAHFDHNMYYRFRRKERLIWPQEQAYIIQVFKMKGIKEPPVFDEYIDQYDWNPLP